MIASVGFHFMIANTCRRTWLTNAEDISYNSPVFVAKFSILLQYIPSFVPTHRRKSQPLLENRIEENAYLLSPTEIAGTYLL